MKYLKKASWVASCIALAGSMGSPALADLGFIAPINGYLFVDADPSTIVLEKKTTSISGDYTREEDLVINMALGVRGEPFNPAEFKVSGSTNIPSLVQKNCQHFTGKITGETISTYSMTHHNAKCFAGTFRGETLLILDDDTHLRWDPFPQQKAASPYQD